MSETNSMADTNSSAQVIVVGVDGSGHADAALAWAIEEARVRGATLRVVHAWQYLPMVAEPMAALPSTPYQELADSAKLVVTEALDRVTGGGEPGVPLDVRIVEGAAGSALMDNADDATLIVVGSRGRGGFKGLLLGSVSQQITHHAHCPVVVLPKGVDR
ncbi:MAG: universal stress protein [Acidimicrobiia bacterium]